MRVWGLFFHSTKRPTGHHHAHHGLFRALANQLYVSRNVERSRSYPPVNRSQLSEKILDQVFGHGRSASSLASGWDAHHSSRI